jgi:hypothetical protein
VTAPAGEPQGVDTVGPPLEEYPRWEVAFSFGGVMAVMDYTGERSWVGVIAGIIGLYMMLSAFAPGFLGRLAKGPKRKA